MHAFVNATILLTVENVVQVAIYARIELLQTISQSRETNLT